MNEGLVNSNRGQEIYECMAEHQRHEDWEQRNQAASLLSWIKRFSQEFKLQLSEVTLKLGNLPIHKVSHFRAGHNEFGLRGEITINVRHLGRAPLGLNLMHLGHALLHAWQHEHSRPPEKKDWHNREFRTKGAELGLLVNENGKTSVQRGGPFDQLVSSCGIPLEWNLGGGHYSAYGDDGAALQRTQSRPKGNSKLKKWMCNCHPPVNVRVAIAEFEALCLRCNSKFRLEDSASSGQRSVDIE